MTFWTEDRVIQAAVLKAQGMGAHAIAKHFNTSKSGVRLMLVREGLSEARPSERRAPPDPNKLAPRVNDDAKHLRLLLASLREQRAT